MVKVQLTNYTPSPVRTVVDEWLSTHPHDTRTEDEIWDFVSKSNLPILEAISFNFRVTGVPIAWREQIVRNRNGAYWIQSGRETVVDQVYDDRNFYIPNSIQNNPKALEVYLRNWKNTQEDYKELISLGIDPGDARLIVGSGQCHLVNFYTDYRNLISIVSNRMCHIAQSSLWKPVIEGIKASLDFIDPRLMKPMMPKCFTTGECKFGGINETRLKTERGELTKETGGDFSGTACPRWKSLAKQG